MRLKPLNFRPSAGIAQLVEHDLAKVGVASSSLVSRSKSKTYVKLDISYGNITEHRFNVRNAKKGPEVAPFFVALRK